MLAFHEKYRAWKYKNTTFLLISIALLFLVIDSEAVHSALYSFSSFGYLGIFIVGIFFVSTFTVAPAIAVLVYMAESFSALHVALVAGLGAVVGDFLLFAFFKDKVLDEIKPLFSRFREARIMHIFSTPYFAWFAPVLGAIIIATPLPDEVGLSLLGSTAIKKWQFILLTFTLNSIGVFCIVSVSRFF